MLHGALLAGIGDDEIKFLIFGGGIMIAVIAILSGAVRRTIVGRQRELTRRELAAYVAEGSMSADDAERLLTAGGDPADGCARES